MEKKELIKEIENAFDGQVKVYSTSKNRIECDVSTSFNKSEWADKLAHLNLVDNSKVIPDSYKCGEYTIVLFYGALSSFAGKLKLNF